MKLSDLTYEVGEHMNMRAYRFVINNRFTGYTFDKQTFNVLDHSTLAYMQPMTAAELDSKLQSGYFDNPQIVGPTNSNQQNVYQLPVNYGNSSSNTGLYVFIGFAALVGLAVWGSRN